MKRLPFLRALLTLLLGFMAFTTATAQTANDPNAGARLTLGSTPGSGDFSWWGQPGRTYFLQRSVDLSAWEYLPLIYSGTDARLAWDFPSAESQLFLRLRSTDLPTNDPYTADFDGDQIGNWDELLQGTDPLAAADTDANGLPDDWEKFYFGQTGVDPNAAVPGGGGLTNLQHFQLGSNPNLPPPPPLDPLLQAPTPVTITASPATLGQSAATLLYPADDSQLLLQNGNFSAPALPTPDRWSIFGVRTDYPNGGIPGWTALSGSLIELQQIAVNPAAGAGQYCELDAHWPTSLHLGPSDHGIQQTVNLARGRYLLFFDYRGRATNARSFTVKASSGPGMIFDLPNPSLKLLASTTTASTNTWQRASVSFAVAGGDPAAAQLPITLLFDIADAADSFGAYIDNVILLPFEMRDVKDWDDANDDVLIEPKKDAKNTDIKSVAWIEPHKKVHDENAVAYDAGDDPRMPQLEVQFKGLPAAVKVQWKFKCKYSRPSGREIPEDEVKFPADGSFTEVAGDQPWKIHQDYNDKPFFGGDIELTYKIIGAGGAVMLPEKTDKFRIASKNPADDRCRKYIDKVATDLLPLTTTLMWYAYAIAKSETKWEGGEIYYNQFLTNGIKYPRKKQNGETDAAYNNAKWDGGKGKEGVPNWNFDGKGKPGGYGVKQVTGWQEDEDGNVPRAVIWSWKVNVDEGMNELVKRHREARDWMRLQRTAATQNALPTHTVLGICFADGSNRIMEDAVSMKRYNGAERRPQPDTYSDPPGSGGFSYANETPSKGHYCYWDRSRNRWSLSRWNNRNPPFVYVQRVCEEIDP